MTLFNYLICFFGGLFIVLQISNVFLKTSKLFNLFHLTKVSGSVVFRLNYQRQVDFKWQGPIVQAQHQSIVHLQWHFFNLEHLAIVIANQNVESVKASKFWQLFGWQSQRWIYGTGDWGASALESREPCAHVPSCGQFLEIVLGWVKLGDPCSQHPTTRDRSSRSAAAMQEPRTSSRSRFACRWIDTIKSTSGSPTILRHENGT